MSTPMSPLRKLFPLLWIVLSLVVAGCGPLETLRQPDKRLDFTKILPETKRPLEVQLLDADGDGKDEWIVFYKFDLVNGATGYKFSPISAAVYNHDHGDPPVVFPYVLYPPGRRYLGEQNCVAEMKDLIASNEEPELLVSCFAEKELMSDLGVFHWYDHDKDDSSKNPGEGRQGYECRGFFHGSGGIKIDGSKIIVKERTQDRSQLSVKNVYDYDVNVYDHGVKKSSYFQPGERELRRPVETSIDFTFEVPKDVTQSPYPEKVVLAFYLALGQDNPLAQTYLSEDSELKDAVRSNSFEIAASGEPIEKVLVKSIRYTPDPQKEKSHREPITVTVSVASVTSAGDEDPDPHDVTWEVRWESNGEDVAKSGWKLYSYSVIR